MGVQNKDNGLFFASGIDNSGLDRDANEAINIVNKASNKIQDVGKQQADEAVEQARRIEQAYDKMTGPEKMAKKIADQIVFLKETIAGIETDIPRLQKAFDNAAPGQAKSNAIEELKAAKTQLAEAKNELMALDAQHGKTSASAQRLTSQIRILKDEMAKMALAGDRDSEAYLKLQSKAGILQKQLTGTNKAMKVLANPNANFQGVISGVTGLTGALSAGMGIMGLFSGENDNLAKIQTKLQSVMAITIGLQQVATVLNKNSAFQLVFVAKAKDMLTAATNRLSVAFGISNVAAQTLMATLTLGLSVAVTALIMLWDKYNDSQTKAAAYSAQTQKMMSDAMDDASKSLGSQMVKLQEMQNRWNSLGDNLKAKKKFIDENRNSFHDLGIEVDTVNDVENALVANTGAVIKALQLRAQAAAYSKVAEGYYEKKARGQMEADEIIHAGPKKEDVPIKYKEVTTQGTAAPVIVEQPYRDINDINGIKKNLRKRADKYRIGGEVNGVYGNNAINYANSLNRQADNLLKDNHIKRYYGSDTYKSDQSKTERERKAAAAKAAREKAKEQKEKEQETKQNASYENKKNEIDSKGNTESKRFLEDQQTKISEDKIASMKDGSDKEIAQMKLNHQKELIELQREKEDRLKSKVDKSREEFTANPKNKGKVFDSSKISLSEDEEKSYTDRYSALLEKQKSEYIEYNKKILENYQTYAQARLEVAEKFEKQRKAFENADASKEQFTQLSKDEQEALNAIDQQFAKKQDSYKTMLATISDMSIAQLKSALAMASKALSDYMASNSTSNTNGVFTTDYANGAPTEKLDANNKVTTQDSDEAANLRATIETLRQKLNEKQTKNVIDNTNGKAGKNAIKDWKNLSTVLDSVDRKMNELGNSIGGTTGEALKAAASISTSVISIISGIATLADTSSLSVTETAKTSSKTIKTLEKASVILTIVASALELLEKIKSIFSTDQSKEYELKFEQEKLELAQEYNKALVEQIALENKVFNTDKIKNAIKYADAYRKAIEGYETLYNANNKSDASLIDPSTGKRYREYVAKLRNEMKVQTSQGNFWKHSKYEDLEKWLKENGYGNLFDDKGELNLDLAKSVSSMSSLTDETKKYLNQLISAKEEADKMDEAIDDYINTEFGSLSDDLMTSLVDSIENGTDAWSEFEKAGSDVIGNLGKELTYTLFYADQFNTFKDKIKGIINGDKVTGETEKQREERITKEIEKETEDFFGTLKDSTDAGKNFMKQWQKDAAANGYDIYSDSDTKSGSTGKLEAALTEGTASEVLGVMNMATLDVRALKEMQASHFANYATTMNNISSILDETRLISANTLKTANNTEGLIQKLDDGFNGMNDKLSQVVKNTKEYTGRG